MKKLLMVLVVGLLLGTAVMADCHSFRKFVKDDSHGAFGPGSAMIATTTYPSAKSSETSGCPDEYNSLKIQQRQFVAVTIDNLSEQIAQGGGPHLQSLSALLGCPASDYSKLAAITQKNYEQLFPSAETEPEVFLARLKEEMRDNPSLAGRCVNI